MSKVPSPKLRRSSSSGNLWPPRRPPLNRSSSGDKSLTRETDNFLLKESNMIDSTDYRSIQDPHKDDITDNNILDDDTASRASEEDSDYDNNEENYSDDDNDSNNFNELSSNIKEDQLLRTPVNDKDVTDYSLHRISIQKEKEQTKNIFLVSAFFIVIAVLVTLLGVFPLLNSVGTQETVDLNTIKEEFMTQDESLWTSFEAGINDVVYFNRPSTFILLYKKEAANTLENLVKQLAKYAVCQIRNCLSKAITVTDTELNSSDIVDDYGRMIDRYKSKLEDRGVMVIKNIENVKGISAQAFHSFCDEYTPLVEKSVFIFTMNFNELNGQNKMNFVEEYFKNKWTDIKIDTFNALITRITSMVLEVNP